MGMNMEYVISRQEHGSNAYFTVRWSPMAKAEKYSIARSVPAVGGIAEFYFKDREGKLNLFCVQRSWYGGLRALARERCDPVLEKDPWRLSILVKWRERIFYRYTCSDYLGDMQDVMNYLILGSAPENAPPPSGRFERFFVEEIDAEKIVTI